jgi:hypothetical protein
MRQPTNIGSVTVLHCSVRVQAVWQEHQQILRISTIWAQPEAPAGRPDILSETAADGTIRAGSGPAS